MGRRLVIVLLALLLATAGVVAVLAYVNQADDRALAGKTTRIVLVAAQSVPAGTSVTKLSQLLRQVKMPAETVPDGAMASLSADTAGQVTAFDLRQGQLLLRAALVAPGGNASILDVPDGKMAVTVQLADPQRVANYVKPKDKIAIYGSFNVEVKKGDKVETTHTTKILMADVEVLAIGQAQRVSTTRPAGQDGSTPAAAAQPSTENAALVTVAVTQVQGEKLVHGIHYGRLYLGLLTDRSNVTPGKGVDDKSVLSD